MYCFYALGGLFHDLSNKNEKERVISDEQQQRQY